MNIVVAAEESAGVHALRALARTEHHIVSVLTSARGHEAVVAREADRLGLTTRPAETVKDPALADLLRSERVDLLINVHSLYLIHARVLESPAIGCFNMHPGPLPEYAGLNAPSWAIYHGETAHGVTIHWMSAGIDSGAVAYESRFHGTLFRRSCFYKLSDCFFEIHEISLK